MNRRMCIKFESRKISVAGYQCDKSDFDFHNADNECSTDAIELYLKTTVAKCIVRQSKTRVRDKSHCELHLYRIIEGFGVSL